MAPRHLLLRLPSELARVGAVGESVRAFCDGAKVAPLDASAIELCVVEAVNNAIEHACGSRPELEITVVATHTEGALTIEIIDRGAPMPSHLLGPDAPSPLDFDPTDIDALPERGFGLSIIRQVMDEVTYRSERGQNALLLVRKLQRAADSPAAP